MKHMENNKDEMLEEVHALALENNKILKSMRRSSRFGFLLKILVWAAVIGLTAWLYSNILQPIFDQLGAAMDQIQATGTQLQAAGSKIGAVTEAAQPLTDIASQSAGYLGKLLDLLPF